MYSEAGKMHLIEDLIKVKTEVVLIEIESVLKKAAQKRQGGKPSAHNFVGLWSKEDAEAIERTIEEACRQIHPDDWKKVRPRYKYCLCLAER